jgi:uncharacterized small protein (DUF1192 family)
MAEDLKLCELCKNFIAPDQCREWNCKNVAHLVRGYESEIAALRAEVERLKESVQNERADKCSIHDAADKAIRALLKREAKLVGALKDVVAILRTSMTGKSELIALRNHAIMLAEEALSSTDHIPDVTKKGAV